MTDHDNRPTDRESFARSLDDGELARLHIVKPLSGHDEERASGEPHMIMDPDPFGARQALDEVAQAMAEERRIWEVRLDRAETSARRAQRNEMIMHCLFVILVVLLAKSYWDWTGVFILVTVAAAGLIAIMVGATFRS